MSYVQRLQDEKIIVIIRQLVTLYHSINANKLLSCKTKMLPAPHTIILHNYYPTQKLCNWGQNRSTTAGRIRAASNNLPYLAIIQTQFLDYYWTDINTPIFENNFLWKWKLEMAQVIQYTVKNSFSLKLTSVQNKISIQGEK